MHHQSRHWTIESDVARIDGVVTTIVDLCEAAGYSSRHCRLNIPVAVTEALSNAIVRGNANDAARDVRVSMRVDSERLFVEVVDEGQGNRVLGTGTGYCVEAALRSPGPPRSVSGGRSRTLRDHLHDCAPARRRLPIVNCAVAIIDAGHRSNVTALPRSSKKRF
jgi:anti-sigma regulatory factor (Ser/Thr protein kinase)